MMFGGGEYIIAIFFLHVSFGLDFKNVYETQQVFSNHSIAISVGVSNWLLYSTFAHWCQCIFGGQSGGAGSLTSFCVFLSNASFIYQTSYNCLMSDIYLLFTGYTRIFPSLLVQ